jgi:hypothetical protein
LFADPKVFDRRRGESWRIKAAVELLKPQNAEETSSSLLELLTPLSSPGEENVLPEPIGSVFEAYFFRGEQLQTWAIEVANKNKHLGFNAKELMKAISRKRRLLTALESYLMANRGTGTVEELKLRVSNLAESTLAHALADDAGKEQLVQLFGIAAEHIERVAPQPARQIMFAKTLLGAFDAASVEAWVQQNEEELRQISTADDWLKAVWPLFVSVVDNNLLTKMEPEGMPLLLALGWLQGNSYRELIALAKASEASKPWGNEKRRVLSEADVLEFLEGCLGFDCPLILAAVGQFLFGATGIAAADSSALNAFQKSLKYGLPSKLTVSISESGLADRCVAQEVATALESAGYDGSNFRLALVDHKEVVESVLAEYPAYFNEVLNGM